jgi:hypothetical protein
MTPEQNHTSQDAQRKNRIGEADISGFQDLDQSEIRNNKTLKSKKELFKIFSP